MKLYIFAIAFFMIGCQFNSKDRINKLEERLIEYRKIKNNSIINLYDAFGKNKEGLVKDFGFSAILKYKGKTILFDAGSNATIFKNNVNVLGIDLKQVDYAIASHSHFDHISGFDYLLEVNPDVKIYFPYDIYWGANFPFNLGGNEPDIEEALPKEMLYFEGNFKNYKFKQSGRFWKADVEYVKENKVIGPGIKLIATSSSNMGNFVKHPLSQLSEDWDKAKIIKLPELSLSLDTDAGDIIIVGCSHSLVEKIIKETQNFTNNPTSLVYGGYHLLPYKEKDIIDLANKLKNDMKVKKVAPAHCTGHSAFKIFKDQFNDNYVFAGLGEEVQFIF